MTRFAPILRGMFCFSMAFVFSARLNAREESAAALPVMQVTGTRLTGDPGRQPYAFYRTDAAELNTRAGRTALDRLNYGPGLFLQRTAPNQASPYIRGLTGEQSLLMLDGVRLSHAMMRPGPNQYSALVPEISIESMDVILGASSAVNGSDGLTGALDIRLAAPGRGVGAAYSPWLAGRVATGTGGTMQSGVDGFTGNWAYSAEVSGSIIRDQAGGKHFRNRVFGPRRDTLDAIPNTAYEEEYREDLAGGGSVYRRREFGDTLDAVGIDLQATTLWQAWGAHELTWGAPSFSKPRKTATGSSAPGPESSILRPPPRTSPGTGFSAIFPPTANSSTSRMPN